MSRVLSPEQKKAMTAGRQKAAAAARKRSVKRVRAFRRWLRADANYSASLRHLMSIQGLAQAEARKRLGRRPRMNEDAAAVTDHDFKVAREEGVE